MEQEYRRYVIGCDRLGQMPLAQPEFETRWQELESHAEQLKIADANRSLNELDAQTRADMEARFKNDSFVRAVLVGMAEDNG